MSICIKELDKLKVTVSNEGQQAKKKNKTKQKKQDEEPASAFTQSLFTFLLQPTPPSSALYRASANFQDPYSSTVSDISSMQRARSWTQFKYSEVFHSQNEHVLQCSWHWFKASCHLMDFFLLPQSHQPPLGVPFPSNRKTFRDLPVLPRSSLAFCFHGIQGPINLVLLFC